MLLIGFLQVLWYNYYYYFFSWYYHATTLFYYIVPQLIYHGITIVYLMYHDNTVNKYHGFWACIMLILFFIDIYSTMAILNSDTTLVIFQSFGFTRQDDVMLME